MRSRRSAFRFLRVGFSDDGFEVVGDGGEFGGGECVCGLVRGVEGEFGLLGVEVVEASLEAGEAVFAAFGCELALFEGFVVALQRLLGAGDFGADRGEPLLELGPPFLGGGGVRRRRLSVRASAVGCRRSSGSGRRCRWRSCRSTPCRTSRSAVGRRGGSRWRCRAALRARRARHGWLVLWRR